MSMAAERYAQDQISFPATSGTTEKKFISGRFPGLPLRFTRWGPRESAADRLVYFLLVWV